TKYFGPVLAVDHINFEIAQGEIVGFLGPNGAGKTTTIRILTSYLPATSGVARVAGFDVMTQSMEVRQNIGYLPESVPLYPEMRIEEYLAYRAKLKGVGRKQRQKRLEFCLDRCRIREVRRRRIGTLSKGYRQRVGLADAMIHDPPILILDEPTVGLDPIQIRETLALIRELGEKRTIILSTHILSEIEAICKRVMVICWGRIGSDKRMADLEAAQAIIVEVIGPADQVANVLRTTEGVALVSTVSLPGGRTGFEVHTQNNKDLREEIAQRLARNNWTLRQLSIRKRKLEDHFFEVVRLGDPLRRSQPVLIRDGAKVG
ncbi:MAG TPA: ATP-binding cassette domain-containing protein, partial [Gemmataceae bacterium]|nr:ATP-binding cassette domain-containing protein [Gemmataceae bacterium]